MDDAIAAAHGPHVLVLGSFPPQAQGISGYCGALVEALGQEIPVEALGFSAMYPALLFPGHGGVMDPTAAKPTAPLLNLRHGLAWYNPLGWLWHAWRSRAGVFHIQWWSLPLFPVCLTFATLARWRNIPVVVTVHNVHPHEKSAAFLWASRVLYGQADHLIVHSETNRSQLLESYPVDPARVSHVPMGVAGLQTAAMEKGEACGALDIDQERSVLLFFGTIRPYKGLEVLLRALALVRDKHPEVLLVVAGALWEPWEPYATLIDQLQLEGNVSLHLEYIPECEVAGFFGAADLVVLPYTHFDAQSAVGVQALSYGKPLLVTETGGLPDLVSHDARWCVPARSSAALAEGILAFMEDPEASRIQFEVMRSAAAAATSWEAAATEHIKIYQHVLDIP